MNSAQQALIFIITNVFQLYIFLVLIRFLLQVARADFYNPFSQFIVKATSPALMPLRKKGSPVKRCTESITVVAKLLANKDENCPSSKTATGI
mgnify:CR=1 FL=1